MIETAKPVAYNFKGNAILFHIIAGNGIIKIRYKIDRYILHVISFPNKKYTALSNRKIIDKRIVNSSAPILVIMKKKRLTIKRNNPMLVGLIIIFDKEPRSFQIK